MTVFPRYAHRTDNKKMIQGVSKVTITCYNVYDEILEDTFENLELKLYTDNGILSLTDVIDVEIY